MKPCSTLPAALSAIALLLGFGSTSSLRAQTLPVVRPSSAQMVAALNGVYGADPKARADHAKGMLLTATFIPAPAAAAISSAPHFQGGASKVMLRFSNFGGFPEIADGAAGAAPYGLALKFLLAGGRETDLLLHSYDGFPAASAAEFVDFLIAMGHSPAGTARPSALDVYAASHPPAAAFLAAPKPAPRSYVSQPYFGVNTFKFTNAAGAVVFGRYRMVPLEMASYLGPRQRATAAPDYLSSELRQELAGHPVEMLLQLQLAGPGDALEDPSIAWPAARTLLTLGRLHIDAPLPADDPRQHSLVFLPDELSDGIEANDPMIGARTRAYVESLERRSQ